MALAHYFAGQYVCTTDTGLNDGGSIALTGAGATKAQRLHGILIKALGTITVVDIVVLNSAGSITLAKIGGTHALQNGGIYSFAAPVNGIKGDNMLIVANLTGATAGSVGITALYEIAN